MKRILFLVVICAMLGSGVAFAGHGHYINGAEGIKAASLPPEGFYWRMYNAYYTADTLKNDSGDDAPGNFDVDVFAVVNRFIYSTPVEILGGNLVMDIIIPLTYTDISYKIGGFNAIDDDRFGVGDIIVEPFLLAWHGDRYDLAAGIGLYMPTGEYDADNAASPGKGFWTVMGTLGGTLYLDQEKSWHASVLARYEVHTEQEETDITPGNDFHFEWGVGKTFADQHLTVGVAGYCGWQTTDDSGSGSVNTREQLMAVGPEIAFDIPAWQMQVSLRSLFEFENRSASQGNITTLTLTKAF